MKFRLFLAATTALAGAAVIAPPAASAAPATELFFSEYIEGSSNNKALEIYNGTGSAVDLGAYAVQMYFNGSTSAGLSIALTGTVADGDVFVLAQSSADPTILAQADQTNGSGWFNGDDAVVLVKGGAPVDSLGQVGFDPGSEWGTGDTSTQDNTLRRKPDVCAGDAVVDDVFAPAVEWDGFAQNTVDGLGAHTANCDGGVGPTVVINEFSASTAGTDVEYVELFGTPSTDLSDYRVLEIEGDGSGAGAVDEVIAPSSLDATGRSLTNLPANALENGTITLLLVTGFTGALGDDLDTDNDGVLDVTPWASVVDAVAVNDGGSGDLTYGVPALGPNYDGLSTFAPGGASRIPDGADTDTSADWVRNDFDLFGIPGFAGTPVLGEAENTPGAANVEITVITDPFGECGDAATLISFIQGSGPASTDLGSIREIEGVVVGDFQDDVGDDGDLNGFFVQEEDADSDGDLATSEGIFVFEGSDPTVDVAKGDVVRVRGTVTEFNGLTEITNVVSVDACGTGTASPAVVELPVDSFDEYEAVEGMAIVAGTEQDLYISEYFNFDRFGEIVLTPERLHQPTAVFDPGSAEAAALAALNARSRLTLDDGRSASNPDPARHPNGEPFTLVNRFRGGDILQNVTGVMDYAFGLYRIQPTAGATYVEANPRPETPDAVGGSLTVASFNVLNYFHTLDDGVNDICGPLQDQECRGADNADERARQLAKIVAAMDVMDADVLGIIEVENTPGVEAMVDIVDGLDGVAGLNDLAGFEKYAYIETGVFGTDPIKQGFIYQPGTVTPLGDVAVLDDPAFVRPFGGPEDFNRPAYAQTFVENATGGVVTVVVNHLKSKGSACGPGDDDPEAGSCNLTRTVTAQVLADWLAGDPTGSGDTDVLIIGDLNSYDKEDPIDVLTAAGYTDLLLQYQGEFAYSYVFDSQLGYLDYGMANGSLLPQVTGATAWHVNADEPDLLDYDTSFKGPNQDAIYAPDPYRASDHDPVIVGLDLNASPVCTFAVPSIDTLWSPNHKMVDVEVLGVTDAEGDAITITIDSIFQDEPVNDTGDGDTAPDGAGVGNSVARVRAERSGTGDGRVYHIAFTARDAAGGSCSGGIVVTVPKSQKSGAAVDGGALYDSTVVPPW